jgi:hypothetical protein
MMTRVCQGIRMLSHDDSTCEMQDVPAELEKALADSGTPPARDGSVNMWCLQFDDASNLPVPGQCLPMPFDLKADSKSSSATQRFAGFSSGGGRVGTAAAK